MATLTTLALITALGSTTAMAAPNDSDFDAFTAGDVTGFEAEPGKEFRHTPVRSSSSRSSSSARRPVHSASRSSHSAHRSSSSTARELYTAPRDGLWSIRAPSPECNTRDISPALATRRGWCIIAPLFVWFAPIMASLFMVHDRFITVTTT